jgi:hypothetical protein
MTQYVFGSGTMIAKRTDVANTPPYMFGVLQDVTLDFDQKLESLIGQYKVAVALGDGELKITGKAKMARWQATLPANLLTGVGLTSGSMPELPLTGESHTVPAVSGPYTVTVTNSSLVPLEDLGVFYQSNGVQLAPAASASGAGIYSFVPSTGVYTFNVADASVAVWIYYSWLAASGQELVYPNQLMGTSPVFELYLKNTTANYGVTKDFVLKLNACKASKLSVPINNQKFAIADFDFQAMADASNNVFTLGSTE